MLSPRMDNKSWWKTLVGTFVIFILSIIAVTALVIKGYEKEESPQWKVVNDVNQQQDNVVVSGRHLNLEYSILENIAFLGRGVLYDFDKRIIAYKTDFGECFIEPMQPHDNPSQIGKVTFGPRRILIASGNSLKEEEIFQWTGWNVASFCKGLLVYKIDEQKLTSFRNGRFKREAYSNGRGGYRGQTQAQYVRFGNSGGDNGQAEAQSSHDSSSVRVSGSNGMGQAQSQSGFGQDCSNFCDNRYIQQYPGSQTQQVSIGDDRFPGKTIIQQPDTHTYLQRPDSPRGVFQQGGQSVLPESGIQQGGLGGLPGVGIQQRVQPGRDIVQPGGVIQQGVLPGGGIQQGVQPGRGIVQTSGVVQQGMQPSGPIQQGVQPGVGIQQGLQPGRGIVQPGGVVQQGVQPGGGIVQPGGPIQQGVQPGVGIQQGLQPGRGIVQPGGVVQQGVQPGGGIVQPGGPIQQGVQPGVGIQQGLQPGRGIVQPGGVVQQGVQPGGGIVQPGGPIQQGVQPGVGIQQGLQPGRGIVQPGGVVQAGRGIVQPGGPIQQGVQPGVGIQQGLQPGRGIVQPGGVVQPGRGIVQPGGPIQQGVQPGVGIQQGLQPGRGIVQPGGIVQQGVQPGGGIVQPGGPIQQGVQPGVGIQQGLQPGRGIFQPGGVVQQGVQPGRGIVQPGGAIQQGVQPGGVVQQGMQQGVQPGRGIVQPDGRIILPAGIQPSGIIQQGVHPGGTVQGVHPGGTIQGVHPGGAIQGEYPGRAIQQGVYPGATIQQGVYPGATIQQGVHPGGPIQQGVHPGGAIQGVYPGGVIQQGVQPSRDIVQPSSFQPGRGIVYPSGGIQQGIQPVGSIVYPGVIQQGMQPGGSIVYPGGDIVQPSGSQLSGFQQRVQQEGYPSSGIHSGPVIIADQQKIPISGLIYPGVQTTSGIQQGIGKGPDVYPGGTGLYPGASDSGVYPIESQFVDNQRYPVQIQTPQQRVQTDKQPITTYYPDGSLQPSIGYPQGVGIYPGSNIKTPHSSSYYPSQVDITRYPDSRVTLPGGVQIDTGGSIQTQGKYPSTDQVAQGPGFGNQYLGAPYIPGQPPQATGISQYPSGQGLPKYDSDGTYSYGIGANQTGLREGEAQAEATVNRGEKDSSAAATAQGKDSGGSTQVQVSGSASNSGSFSAQAQTSGNDRSAQTQVQGNSDGLSSSAQGQGGSGQAQAQIKLSGELGHTQAEAQSGGYQHGTNTQVQAGSEGGLANAQAQGSGRTSSQAQMGFKPNQNLETDSNITQQSPYKGGGTASAQGNAYSGQSQTQIQGTFQYGISYTGAAQAGSNYQYNNNNDNSKATYSWKPLQPFTYKSENVSKVSNPPTPVPLPNYQYVTTQSPLNARDSSNVYRKGNDNNEEENEEGDENDNEEEYEDEDNDENSDDDDDIIRRRPSQSQHVSIPKNINAQVIRATSPPLNGVFQPGESIPGTNGYKIPDGFRGRISSSAGKVTSALGPQSQGQTVILTPKKEYSYKRQDQPKLLPTSSKAEPDTYVSVTKSVTGEIPQPSRRYHHTYYTKSSTCGYFTFSCNVVYGTNGRTKICKPQPSPKC